MVWSLGFIVLWLIATFITLRHLLAMRKSTHGKSWTSSDKHDFARYFARLMLLCSAALTLYLFISSPVSAAFPADSRYLIGLLISTPVLIWPLWDHFGKKDSTSQHTAGNEHQEEKRFPLTFTPTKLQTMWSKALVVIFCMLLLIGTIDAFLEIPTVQAYNKQQDVLIHELAQLKISHFYTEYW